MSRSPTGLRHRAPAFTPAAAYPPPLSSSLASSTAARVSIWANTASSRGSSAERSLQRRIQPEPLQQRLGQAAVEQGQLQLLEPVEQAMAAPDGAPSLLGRVRRILDGEPQPDR